jgi:hypothetical protein
MKAYNNQSSISNDVSVLMHHGHYYHNNNNNNNNNNNPHHHQYPHQVTAAPGPTHNTNIQNVHKLVQSINAQFSKIFVSSENKHRHRNGKKNKANNANKSSPIPIGSSRFCLITVTS